jgi:hypothetical protein
MTLTDCHIHTTYSFSPYSPSEAARGASEASLAVAGIVDHDTVAGAEEFVAAARSFGMAAAVGMECRASMAGTPFEGRTLNNPSQRSVAYMVLHGIRRSAYADCTEFMSPYRKRREERNRAMTEKLNGKFAKYGVRLDYERDVREKSRFGDGGSVTERHILFALAGKILTAAGGDGTRVVSVIEAEAGARLPEALRARILPGGGPFYEYYALAGLKALGEIFYIDAREELPPVGELVSFSGRIGALLAYAYLGGENYEDGYLDELTSWLPAAGIRALTFAPSRDTEAQIARVQGLCEKNGLFQIAGDDVNSPFQAFASEKLSAPGMEYLAENAREVARLSGL